MFGKNKLFMLSIKGADMNYLLTKQAGYLEW